MALKAVGKLPVAELRGSGQGGVAGDRRGRVEVAGRHGGQRAEHGAKLVRGSVLKEKQSICESSFYRKPDLISVFQFFDNDNTHLR